MCKVSQDLGPDSPPSFILSTTQATSRSYMISLDNPHAVNLDSTMQTPFQLTSANTIIMQSMALLTQPTSSPLSANHTLVFFGRRDVNIPGRCGHNPSFAVAMYQTIRRFQHHQIGAIINASQKLWNDKPSAVHITRIAFQCVDSCTATFDCREVLSLSQWCEAGGNRIQAYRL